jgi:hypothetical protein
MSERPSNRSKGGASSVAAVLLMAVFALVAATPAHAQSTFISPVDSLDYFADCGYEQECRYAGLHAGVDFTGNGEGTPVKAMADGKVVKAGWDDGMGWFVVIEHRLTNGATVYTLLGHFRETPSVQVGACVPRGGQVGVEGATGAADGAHVHTEVRTFSEVRDGYAPDPSAEGYLDPLAVIGSESYLTDDMCSAPPAWKAGFDGHVLPRMVGLGECGEFEVRLSNLGTSVWKPGEVFLRTQQPQDGAFVYATGEWGAHRNRVPLVAETPPGSVGRFRARFCVPVNAKFPDRVVQRFDVVAEHKQGFGGELALWLAFFAGDATHSPFEHGDYGAQLVHVDPVPEQVRRGERLCLRVRFVNSYLATLFREGVHPLNLRGTGPEGEVNDRSSAFLDPDAANAAGTLGVHVNEERTAPGDEFSFDVSVRVSDRLAPGTYTEAFRLVNENALWWGPVVRWTFNVADAPPAALGDRPACEASSGGEREAQPAAPSAAAQAESATPPEQPPTPARAPSQTAAQALRHFTTSSSGAGILRFAFTQPGRLVVRAFAVRAGARRAKRVRIARIAQRVTAGRLTVVVRPSPAGRRALMRMRRARITWVVTFTPRGGRPTTTRRSVLLRTF